MNLQKKIILVIVPLFMIYGAFGLAIQRLIIMPSFDALERDEATKNMPRAQQALEREIHHLGLASNDWAHWDDTHRFVTRSEQRLRWKQPDVHCVQRSQR